MQENKPAEMNDKTLQSAWETMFTHDQQAVDANKTYKQTRYGLIIVTVLSTLSAVFASFVTDKSSGAHLGFALLALILPIFGNFAISYIQKFGRVSQWLEHRLIAERMRGEIYFYRMKAAHYDKLKPIDHDDELSRRIGELDKLAGTEMHIAQNKSNSMDWRKRLKDENQDDGEELSFEKYLDIRGRQQEEWYEARVNKNFRLMHRLAVGSLVVQGLGAMIVAISLTLGWDSRFIASTIIANALSFGINAWTTVAMTGQVYGIFNIAGKEIRMHRNLWLAAQNNKNMNRPNVRRAKELEIVEKIEGTLTWEREEWYRVALQTLSSNDQSLFQAIEELHKRGAKAEGQNLDGDNNDNNDDADTSDSMDVVRR
jgi:hypothetical protein